MFPGGEDMQQLFAQAQQLQEQLMAAQEQLTKTVFKGSSGGGLVKARVNGAGELLGLDIDPEAADPNDTETLADLIVAAVRDANRAADEAKANALGPLAEGFGGEGVGGLLEGGLGGALGPGTGER